jgi:hypothetical protein
VQGSGVEQDSDGLLHFTYTKQGQPSEFLLRYERAELIINAWAGPAEKKQPESGGSISPVE